MNYRYFSVEPPPGAGKPFLARIDENSVVTSTRHGDWGEETRLTDADLYRPEQAFIEWDIRPIADPYIADTTPKGGTGMLERTTIDGKSATVAYLKSDMQPATKENHTFVKVIFDDGNVVFAQRAEETKAQSDPVKFRSSSNSSHGSHSSNSDDEEGPDISRQEETWLTTAVEDLGIVYSKRKQGSSGNEAFCRFELNDVYLQCMARYDRDEILVESVSEISNYQLSSLLTEEKRSRLVKFGFSPPGVNPNYSRVFPVQRDTIVEIAKLVFMTLGFVYDIRDITRVDISVSLPSVSEDPVHG